MKKVLLAVVVLLLLGAGGYYLYAKKMAAPSTQSGNTGGVFATIKDALSKQLSLQCNFTNDDGAETVAFMKAGAVRVNTNGKTADQTWSFITKDKKIYYWQTNSTQGTMMDISDVSVTPATGSTVTPTNAAEGQADNVMGMLEKFKDKCKAAIVEDSLFTPPANVKFVNISEMMKAVPTGSPNGMNQQDVQKLMQQYQSK